MDSRTYWRLREEKWIKEQIKDDAKLAKEVNQRLVTAYDDIQKEIYAFYTRYATTEGISMSEVRKRVSNHDVQKFSSKAKQYVKDRDFSDRANEELRLYNLTMKVNRLEMLKAEINLQMIGATDEIDKLLQDDAYKQAMTELERNAGILGDSAKIDVRKRAEQVVEGSFNLKDSDVLTVFSDNIWLYKTELVNDLDKLLVRSFTMGQNPRVMARELKKKFDVFGYQAERLARTEMSEMSARIQKQSFIDNGMDEYEVIAEPSACKKTCAPMDGKVYKIKDLVVGKTANPFHPNCRCSIVGHTDPTKMYDDWLKRGIISKDEYASLLDFRKDYDAKFEKLMEKKRQRELEMAEKRKQRLPKDHKKKST